jgi:hypothetical protein
MEGSKKAKGKRQRVKPKQAAGSFCLFTFALPPGPTAAGLGNK